MRSYQIRQLRSSQGIEAAAPGENETVLEGKGEDGGQNEADDNVA